MNCADSLAAGFGPSSNRFSAYEKNDYLDRVAVCRDIRRGSGNIRHDMDGQGRRRPQSFAGEPEQLGCRRRRKRRVRRIAELRSRVQARAPSVAEPARAGLRAQQHLLERDAQDERQDLSLVGLRLPDRPGVVCQRSAEFQHAVRQRLRLQLRPARLHLAFHGAGLSDDRRGRDVDAEEMVHDDVHSRPHGAERSSPVRGCRPRGPTASIPAKGCCPSSAAI